MLQILYETQGLHTMQLESKSGPTKFSQATFPFLACQFRHHQQQYWSLSSALEQVSSYDSAIETSVQIAPHTTTSLQITNVDYYC